MKLNLGCGVEIKPEYTNIDKNNLPGVDIIADLEVGIPLVDNSAEEVFSCHFLEHVENLVGLVKEIYRVLEPNGLWISWVPCYETMWPNSPYFGAIQDPDHKRIFCRNTFNYFIRGERENDCYRLYGFEPSFAYVSHEFVNDSLAITLRSLK